MARPTPSEWGKLNAGQPYGILAVDLDRALAHAGLSEHEQGLMQYIREYSWGTSARRKQRGEPWPDAEPVRLSMGALAGLFGVPMQRLYEARARLVESRMLLVEGREVRINKNAHEWVWPGSGDLRLSPAKLTYAASARARKKGMTPPPEFTDEREENSRSNVNPDSRSNVKEIHGQPLNDFTVKRENDSRLTVNGHREERARVPEDFKKTEEDAATAAADRAREAAAAAGTTALAGSLLGEDAARAILADAVKLHGASGGDWRKVNTGIREAATIPGGPRSLIGFLIAGAPKWVPDSGPPVLTPKQATAPVESKYARKMRDLSASAGANAKKALGLEDDS